jgi:hypothetical protein
VNLPDKEPGQKYEITITKRGHGRTVVEVGLAQTVRRPEQAWAQRRGRCVLLIFSKSGVHADMSKESNRVGAGRTTAM